MGNTMVRTQINAEIKTQIDADISENQRKKNQRQSALTKAQASLEVTLSLICVTILLFGAIGIFIWLTENITRRQEDFEASRVEAGDINPGQEGVYLDESNYSKLDLFGESQ